MLVGFGEGAAEHARAGYHDLGDYAMRLQEKSGWLARSSRGRERGAGCEGGFWGEKARWRAYHGEM